MKRSIIGALVAVAVATLIAGCGQSGPAVQPSAATAPSAPSERIRPEDEELLNNMRVTYLAVSEMLHTYGEPGQSLIVAKLDEIEEARVSLAELERERVKFVEAGKRLYLAGQLDPDALNHALQGIENARQEILARFTE